MVQQLGGIMNRISIAIDGPAAAGKSTVAKIVANKLNYIYVDTGAMYRGLTFQALQKGIDLQEEVQLLELLKKTEILLKPSENGQRVLVNGRDVSSEIRGSEVTNHVSIVARHRMIREEMVRRQKTWQQRAEW